VLGLVMGGPVVIAHGSDDQKERFLEPILSGEEIWCQGFSEPESGSDLASLKSRAVKSNGGWKVSGQKVWTTYAHEAKWCMLLARSDQDAPKHKGITYFLLDMDQPGVEVRPLRQITGEAEFNEIFLEEAEIPDENVIGEVGGGWGVAITTLMFERAGLGAVAVMGLKRSLADLVELIRAKGLEDDAVLRQKVARLQTGIEAMRLGALRALTMTMKTGIPGPEGSLGKWQWATYNQELTELASEVAGPAGVTIGSDWSYRFLRSRANSIEGGTTEVLQNIIAERVLGLPKLR
jgi:alkylation response protein AidB-like acyl-CoA dehydrogenase